MSSLESNIFFMARRRKSFRPKFSGKLGRMDLRKVNSFFQLALPRKGRSLFFKPFLDIQLMTSWWNFFDQTNSIDEKQSLLYYIKQPTGTNCFQNCVLFAFLTLLMALKRGVRLRVEKQKISWLISMSNLVVKLWRKYFTYLYRIYFLFYAIWL